LISTKIFCQKSNFIYSPFHRKFGYEKFDKDKTQWGIQIKKMEFSTEKPQKFFFKGEKLSARGF